MFQSNLHKCKVSHLKSEEAQQFSILWISAPLPGSQCCASGEDGEADATSPGCLLLPGLAGRSRSACLLWNQALQSTVRCPWTALTQEGPEPETPRSAGTAATRPGAIGRARGWRSFPRLVLSAASGRCRNEQRNPLWNITGRHSLNRLVLNHLSLRVRWQTVMVKRLFLHQKTVLSCTARLAPANHPFKPRGGGGRKEKKKGGGGQAVFYTLGDNPNSCHSSDCLQCRFL